MTTFWLSFTDPEATSDKRFLGVAIFDMDESGGELSMAEIIKHAWALGVNPGGAVSVQKVGHVPDEHKNKPSPTTRCYCAWVRAAGRTHVSGEPTVVVTRPHRDLALQEKAPPKRG